MNINKEILKTIKYFSFFAYYPTLTEIHMFLQVKISKNELKKELEGMVKQKLIVVCQLLINNSQRYTVGEYGTLSQKSKVKSQKYNSKVKSNNVTIEQWNNLIEKQQISKNKLNSSRFKLYIGLLNLFPQIKLAGLSGSISMMNAKEDDDIYLFIIMTKNRLFT